MNEEGFKKSVIGFAFVFLVLVIVVLSVCDNLALRRADSTIDTLTEQLDDAQRRISESRERLSESRAELSDCRRTVDECRRSVGQIANGLERQSTELGSIIENLRTVRAEVKNMENALDKFYDKYGNNDDDNYNNGSEVK